MKKRRHELILKLIKENVISTQEELLEKLVENGFAVTQATVSRDINELHLVKVQTKQGQKYAINEQNSNHINKFHTIFAQSVISVDFGGNICCIFKSVFIEHKTVVSIFIESGFLRESNKTAFSAFAVAFVIKIAVIIALACAVLV